MRAPVAVFVALVFLSAFTFGVFAEAPAPGARHWAAAPLLAVSILFVMGGLVAIASGPGIRRGR